MIERQAPNGTTIQFPEGTSEADINAYLSLEKYQVQEEEENVNSERGLVSDVPLQILGGVRDGVQATLGFVEGLGDTLGEKTNIGALTFGDEADNGIIGYKSHDELVADGSSNAIFGKFGVKDAIQLPKVDAPDTVSGGLIRGVSQFATGWLTGGRLLKGATAISSTGTAIKITKATLNNPIKTSLAKGAVADTLAFDEEVGRFADIVNEFAPSLSNPLTDYLSSDPEDTFWEGRFKNALEGLVLGGAVESIFRTTRYMKNKKQQLNNEKFDEKILKEDEQYLSTNKLEKNPQDIVDDLKLQKKELKANKPEKIKVKSKLTKEDVVKDFEGKIFENFKKLQGSTKNNKEFKQQLSLQEGLDLGINTKSFRILNKDGLFTLKNIAEANKRAFKKVKAVRSDSIVEALAERKYGGNIARVYDDFGKFADNLEETDALIVAHEIMHQTVVNVIPKLAREIDAGVKGSTLADLKLAMGLAEGGWLNTARVEAGLGRGLRQVGRVKQSLETLSNNTESNLKDITGKWRTFDGNLKDLVKQIAQADDANATAKIIAFATKNKSWNVANEVWINALLSNPKTHIINMSSNLINTFLRPLEALVGSRMRLVGFENASQYAKLKEQGEDAFSSLAGLTMYLDDVIKYTKLSFKKADGILVSGAGKLDNPIQSIEGLKGSVIRTPTRFLNAEDEFFKQINYRARLYSIAMRKAIADGASKTKVVASELKTKKPITEFEASVMNTFREGFDETGTVGINPNALQYAKEATYTQDLFGIFQKIQNMTNDHPYLRQIIPFVKTPINLMMAVVDRTPLGFARKQFRDDFMGRGGDLFKTAQVRGQLATGMALITYANILASSGNITGSTALPHETPLKSRGLKDLNRSLGFQPYSFRYFDEEEGVYKYTAFGRFDPFGAFFGLVADYHAFHTKLTEEELARVGNSMLLTLARQGEDVQKHLSLGTRLGNMASAGVSSLQRNLLSKTYLRGLTESLQILTDDDPNKFNRAINSKFGSFIPSVYTKLVNDPFYRDAKNIIEEAKRRTGTAEVQKKYDFRGDAYMAQGTDSERLITGLFNPFTTTRAISDPVAEEILRLGVNVPNVSQYYNGAVDLTLFKNKSGINAYDRLNTILSKTTYNGKTLDQALQSLIQQDFYKNNLSDPIVVDENIKNNGGKHREIRKLIKRYHKIAEIELLGEMDNFISTKDKTGKFSLKDANFKAVGNKNKIKLGIQINNSDIEELYKFSQ